MPVAMVVAMEIPVNSGYGPHLRSPALPWKQGCIATIGFNQQIYPFHWRFSKYVLLEVVSVLLGDHI